MIYQSPIELFTREIIGKFEDGAVKAVQDVGFHVDKEELEKALIADHRRYETAYQRGYEARDKDIIRCKECRNWIMGYITERDDFIPPKCGKYQQMVGHSANDFCSLAEMKEE